MGDLLRIKRGLRTNLPDLMQGEFGFCTDTNELFIGAVDENLKIGGNDKEYLDVKAFGAKGDGVTDDTDAIKLACVKAGELKTAGYKCLLDFSYAKSYKVIDTITVPAGVDVRMNAPMIYFGSENEACLIIGETNVSNVFVNLKLYVKRNTYSDWTSENNIGIVLINTALSNVEIVRASNFTIGVQCLGSYQGFTLNQLALGRFENNKYGLDLNNEHGGYVNENLFTNGSFSIDSLCTVNIGKDMYAVRMKSKDGGYTGCNGNIFLKPCFESNDAFLSPGKAIPILIERGGANQFVKCRAEATNDIFAVITSTAGTENIFELNYRSSLNMKLQDDSPNMGNVLKFHSALDQFNTPIFLSGALHKKACMYNGATKINIPNVHFGDVNDAVIYKATPRDSADNITTSYFESLYSVEGLGVFVDTTNVKEFVIRKDCVTGHGGRVSILCYDSAGALLTDASPNYPHVKIDSSVLGYSTTLFGGGNNYLQADFDGDIGFTVKPNVCKIRLMLTAGTASLQIRGFSIYTTGKFAPVYAGYEEIVPDCNLATTPPTAGTWTAGRMLYNATPTVGQPKGWVCTVGGTPGTWVSLGNL